MAAGENEEEDEVCISTTTSPHKSHDEEIRREDGPGVSYSDYLCPICLQIIVEPVVMPCKHELCRPCFKKNVEEANLRCPLCRIRISSWARKQARNGTLVHRKRWEQIQRLFPERCEKRLRGEDDDDDLNGLLPAKRVLSEAGEVHKEYELEMNKIRQAREEEIRASEEVIRKLQEEELKLVKTIEHQTKQDEDLAKKMEQDEKQRMNISQEQRRHSQEHANGNSTGKTKIKKSKKTSSTPGPHTRTLDRWFSPTSKPRSSNSTWNCPGRLETEKADIVANNPKSYLSNTASSPGYYLSTCSTKFEEVQEKQKQEKTDYQLAIELQKQFDLEAKRQQEVERKKGTADSYQLRSEVCNDYKNS